MADIKEVSDRTLRAWADCRVISSARYVEEINRRAGGLLLPADIAAHARAMFRDYPDGRVVDGDPVRIPMKTPPLDYALDDDLAIPYLHHDLIVTGDEETQPAPPALMFIAGIVAVLLAVALWMVFR